MRLYSLSLMNLVLFQKKKFINAINSDTILVSVMAVNNETGIIQPIKLVSNIISKSGSPALFHCDAVQAFGKVNLKPQKAWR